jgi:hypothetical protein
LSVDLKDACTVWQSGRDGGSSRLRGGARVLTAVPHYFRATYIRDHTLQARAQEDTLTRARLLLDAVASSPPRSARQRYGHCGLNGRAFAGRGIESKCTQGEDEQIWQALRAGEIEMPLWGFSLDRRTAEEYGRGKGGDKTMAFLFELEGRFRGIAAWEHSKKKLKEREIIASGLYTVVSLKPVVSSEHPETTWHVKLRERAPLWPVST